MNFRGMNKQYSMWFKVAYHIYVYMKQELVTMTFHILNPLHPLYGFAIPVLHKISQFRALHHTMLCGQKASIPLRYASIHSIDYRNSMEKIDFRAMTSLNTLICGRRCEDADLADMRGLTTLNCGDAFNLTKQAFFRLHSLHTLDCGQVTCITDAVLSCMLNLRVLRCGSAKITDYGISQL
jgi:hypothetical protein